MKKSILKISAVLCLSLLAVGAIAQANVPDDDDKKKKKKIEKRIEVVEENGVKTVTVTTIENGKKTKEVYSGEDADKFIKEMETKHSGADKEVHMKFDMDSSEDGFEFNFGQGEGEKIQITIEDGVKRVKVTKSENGEESVEVYEGEEADKFLEEHHKNMMGQDFGDMHFDFRIDSNICLGNMSNIIMKFHESFDSLNIEEHMKELQDKMGEMHSQFNIQMFSEGEEIPEHIQKLLEDMDINLEELKDGTSKRMMIGTMIAIEDVENEEGVENLEVETFDLYPNPTTGQLIIKFDSEDDGPVQVDITTMDGKQVFTQKVSGSRTYELNVDLGDQAAGTHIINLTKDGKRKSKKLILQ